MSIGTLLTHDLILVYLKEVNRSLETEPMGYEGRLKLKRLMRILERDQSTRQEVLGLRALVKKPRRKASDN